MTLTRTSAKNYFLTNLKPTQAQFAELFEGIVFQQGASAQFVQSNVSAQGIWDFLKPVSVSGGLSVVGAVSAVSLNVTGDVRALTGKVLGSAANFSGIVSANAFAPASTSGIIGTATNDSAAAGSVGEFQSATLAAGSATALTSNVSVNLTSLALTAGDWDIWGNVYYTGNVATTVSNVYNSVSTNSATNSVVPGMFASMGWTSTSTIFGSGNPTCCVIGPGRVSIASTTTYFLVSLAIFATNTCSSYGIIQARRVR